MMTDESNLGNVLSLDRWIEKWKIKQIGFHNNYVHPLYDQGHEVVGVEIAEVAVKEFFEEHDIPFSIEILECVNGKVFKSNDGRLRLYACDLFLFKRANDKDFDAIWDRGSLIAINRADRQKYADTIRDLLKADGVQLLVTLTLPATYPGPPHLVSPEVIRNIYGPDFHLEKLAERDDGDDKWRSRGVDMFEYLYLISQKQ